MREVFQNKNVKPGIFFNITRRKKHQKTKFLFSEIDVVIVVIVTIILKLSLKHQLTKMRNLLTEYAFFRELPFFIIF